jgi:trimeric autotransporter adhesin
MPSAATPSPRRATRTSLRDRLRARAGSEDGFTLIEVIVSALIVILISVAVVQALIASSHLTSYQRTHSQADQIAQQDQERLRGLSSKELSALVTPQTYAVSLDGTNYTVTSQATLRSSGGSSSCSTSGTGAIAYYHTTSTVSWTGINQSSQSVQEESMITPPAGGTLLAQVNNQTGAGLAGVNVEAVGPSDDETATTDTTGCVYFADLTAGSFAINFTDTGYVDPNGNTPVTSSATVTSTGTALPSSNPIVMGQAGTVNAGFSTVTSSGTTGSQTAPSLSWYGSGSASSMTNPGTTTSSSPASSLTASNMFPFYYVSSSSYTGNYQLWSGQCLQERPPTGINMTSVLPGSSSSMTVQEPALDVLTTWGGTRVAPAHVKITFASTTGTPCTESWYPTVAANAATSATGSLAYPGQPFASNATSGSTASASLQTGQLTVCADYKSGSTYYRNTANTYNTSYTGQTPVTVAITNTSTKATC